MRAAVVVALCLFLMGSGCGYVGPVLPPSPQIPATITDLAVVERGDQIIINFTTPPRTLDGVAITHFSNLDLRLGPVEQSPEAAKSYDLELPSESDREDPQPKPVKKVIPASEWTGQRIAVQVRTAVKKTGHLSAWSNKVVLEVVAPLAKPLVRVANSAGGIVLTWEAEAGAEYLVQRQGPDENQPAEIGIAESGQFLDKTASSDIAYRYTVMAKKGAAESLPFETPPFTAQDIFAPAVPTGLTALAGPDGVNLAWQRNTESDLQGYYLYRSENAGPFQRLGGVINVPAYSDHTVQPEKTYRYKISSLDKKGNESDQSAEVSAQF